MPFILIIAYTFLFFPLSYRDIYKFSINTAAQKTAEKQPGRADAA